MKTTKMCACLIAAFGLMAVPAIADLRYQVFLPNGRIGATVVPSGDYSVVVDGTAVKLTDVKTGKVLDVNPKVVNLEKKNGFTEVHSKTEDGVTRISEIRLGGTKISIDFREQTTP